MSSSKIKDVDELYFFGWDMLVKSIENDIIKKADIVLALVHFILVKHYKFRCLGVGESKIFTDEEIGSELLPDLWNDIDFEYRLRYLHNKQLYVLIGQVISEDNVLFNLLSADTNEVSNILLNQEDIIKSIRGKIYTMIPDATALTDRIRREFIETVLISRNESEVSTQTDRETFPRQLIDPLRTTLIPGYRAQLARPSYRVWCPDVDRGERNVFNSGNSYSFPPPNLVGNAWSGYDPFQASFGNIRKNTNARCFRPPRSGDNY